MTELFVNSAVGHQRQARQTPAKPAVSTEGTQQPSSRRQRTKQRSGEAMKNTVVMAPAWTSGVRQPPEPPRTTPRTTNRGNSELADHARCLFGT